MSDAFDGQETQVEGMAACDFCERRFNRAWLLGASGSMLKCLHCHFSAVWLEPELAVRSTDREWTAVSQGHGARAARVAKGGVAAFIQTGLALHDVPGCRWGGRSRCVLCAAAAAGLDGAGEQAVARWVEQTFPQSVSSRSGEPPSPGDHSVEDEALGAWVIHATRKQTLHVARELATNAQIGKILGRSLTEPEAPWLGFDRHDLPAIVAFGLELATPQSRSAGVSRVPRGLFQLVAMGEDWIEVVDSSWKRHRMPAPHLEARDALGRLEPSAVPKEVGVRLARRLRR